MHGVTKRRFRCSSDRARAVFSPVSPSATSDSRPMFTPRFLLSVRRRKRATTSCRQRLADWRPPMTRRKSHASLASCTCRHGTVDDLTDEEAVLAVIAEVEGVEDVVNRIEVSGLE